MSYGFRSADDGRRWNLCAGYSAVLAAILRSEGCKVTTARSGQECLRMVARSRPDIILMDVQMPGMDGYEATSALSSDPGTAGIPVVLVTALAAAEHRVRGLRAGAVDFLTKPVDPPELKGTIEIYRSRCSRAMKAGSLDGLAV